MATLKTELLPTIVVITKDGRNLIHALENNLTFEELTKYLKELYNNNIDKIILGETIGYTYVNYNNE